MLDLSPYATTTAPVPTAASDTPLPPALLPFTTEPVQVESVQRSIGGIMAQVTVEEDHDDELVITEHPVEYGASITDHAYKRPSEVRVRVGWTDAAAWSAPHGGAMDPIGDVRAVYEQILALQYSRIPFTVVTGKRQYVNMLVASVRVHTDARFETTLLADITLREIILVSTVTLSGINAGAMAFNWEMPTVNNGPKYPSLTALTAQQVRNATGVPL